MMKKIHFCRGLTNLRQRSRRKGITLNGIISRRILEKFISIFVAGPMGAPLAARREAVVRPAWEHVRYKERN